MTKTNYTMEKNKFKFISQEVVNNNGLNTSKNLGQLSKLIGEFKPNTIEEWEDYYFEYLKDTGLNNKIINNIDRMLIKYPKVKRWEIQNVLRTRAIDNTWNGWERETSFEKIFKKQYPNLKIEHTDYKTDSVYGVDFLIYNNNELIAAYQVKPMSYLKNNNKYIMKDKGRNQAKYNKFYELNKIKVIEVGVEDNKIVFNKNIVDNLQYEIKGWSLC